MRIECRKKLWHSRDSRDTRLRESCNPDIPAAGHAIPFRYVPSPRNPPKLRSIIPHPQSMKTSRNPRRRERGGFGYGYASHACDAGPSLNPPPSLPPPISVWHLAGSAPQRSYGLTLHPPSQRPYASHSRQKSKCRGPRGPMDRRQTEPWQVFLSVVGSDCRLQERLSDHWQDVPKNVRCLARQRASPSHCFVPSRQTSEFRCHGPAADRPGDC